MVNAIRKTIYIFESDEGDFDPVSSEDIKNMDDEQLIQFMGFISDIDMMYFIANIWDEANKDVIKSARCYVDRLIRSLANS